MTVLFSPVGTADPLTQLGDGPMLHIIRYYNPDRIVLFFTKKMMKYQHKDARYTEAIRLLSERLLRPMPEIDIVESSSDEIYKFDVLMSEFEEILKNIESSDEPILINTSSGTPAMSQSLVALGSFGRLDLKMLQVKTPRDDTNQAHDREDPDKYELDTLWGLNPDNEAGATSRIMPVETPNFSELLLRENVLKLVEAYEYEAAYILCKNASGVSDGAVEMIHAAANRLNLDGQLPAKVFGGTSLRYKTNDLLGEYLYMMEVRLEQGHWADFVRAMSPALTEIMKRVLAPYVSERLYNLYENGRPTGKYNLEGIRNDARLGRVFSDVLEKSAHGKSRGGYINNDSYCRLVEEYCKDEEQVEKVRTLRKAEFNCRNGLAHEIKSSPKASLEKECGIPLSEVMQLLFDLCKGAEPGLYRRINAAIEQVV